jgi:hypothetical protein
VPCTTSEIFFDLGGRLRTGILGRDSAKNNDVHEYSKERGVAKVPVRQIGIHVSELEGNEVKNVIRRRLEERKPGETGYICYYIAH